MPKRKKEKAISQKFVRFTTLPVQKKSCHFNLNQQIGVLGLLQLVISRHCKSAEFLNVLNDQVIPLMDFFFPGRAGIFQDDNAKIDQALVVKEWEREDTLCQGARGVIFTHELAITES